MAFILNHFSRTQNVIYLLWYRCENPLLEPLLLRVIGRMMHFSVEISTRLIKPDECNDAANADYATSATPRAIMLF